MTDRKKPLYRFPPVYTPDPAEVKRVKIAAVNSDLRNASEFQRRAIMEEVRRVEAEQVQTEGDEQ